MDELFEEKREAYEPLALKCTPQSLDEFFGQEKIIGKGGILYGFIAKDRLVSCIFYGPPGSGKTALAKLITRITKSDFIRLNAVTTRVEDLRTAFHRASLNRRAGKKTILFIDEIHRFNKMQQDGLLPAVEEGLITLIGTTTKNPFFSLIPPLRSRVLLLEFDKLSEEALSKILMTMGKKELIEIEDAAREFLLRYANGDARRMFNLIEAALIIQEGKRVDLKTLETLIRKQSVLYDRDEDYHFDVISAFIKSVRGSDPDSALYWLALMLEGGEDPLYISRRLLILASEDIGLADPLSLVLAEAACRAVDMIGMPEARLILSHVTLYLSLQPKSNSAYKAIESAAEYVKTHPTLDVPAHLKSSGPDAARYVYPHDFKYHFVKQEYLGDAMSFYEPGDLGNEKELKKRLEFLKKLKSGEA